jgi:hypothetical protein
MQHIDSSLERSQRAAEWGKLVAILVASVERRAQAAAIEERLRALERRAQALRWPAARVDETNAPSPAVQRLVDRLAIARRAPKMAEMAKAPSPVQRLAERLARATLEARVERVSDRRLRVCSRARASRAHRRPRPSCRSRAPDDPDPGDPPPLGAQRGGLRHALRDAGYHGGREQFGSGPAPC